MNAEPSNMNSQFELPAEWWLRLGHDLRGPIGPMRMAVQLLRSERAPQVDRDDALQLIDRQIDRLLTNIEDVNDILRLNAGTFALNLTAGDLNLVFDVVCGRGELLRYLDERQVSLRCVPPDSPVVAIHDPTRLAALLEFLLRKSAEQSARGQTLRLALRSDSGRANVSVTGAGNSLATDPSMAYLTGTDSIALGDLEAKPIVMKEIARLSDVVFSPFDEETGISFSLPISAPVSTATEA